MFSVKADKASRMIGTVSCCTFLAFVTLMIAAFVPMFVMTHLTGHAKLLFKEFDVEIAIAQGLWKRNVCYGKDRPEENTLKKFGLTCEGTMQTEHCDDNKLTDKQRDRCDHYELMQGMETLALFAVFIAGVMGAFARNCATVKYMGCIMKFGHVVALAVGVSAAISVISLVKDSDMVHENTFGCEDVFDANLCHGWGPSYALQWTGIVELLIALVLSVILLFMATGENGGNHFMRIPLLNPGSQNSGVTVSTQN